MEDTRLENCMRLFIQLAEVNSSAQKNYTLVQETEDW